MRFPDLIDGEEFPLSPDQAGNELVGDNVVEFIELIAALIGLPLVDKNGAN